jgi:toxin ParE1/3/4
VIVVVTAEAEGGSGANRSVCRRAKPAERAHVGPRVAERCESLLDAPHGYPLVPRYEHLGIRRRPFGRFLIFYRVSPDAIEIIDIFHGAREYESLLFPEE